MRIRSALISALVAVLVVAFGAAPAHAAPWYFYKPGHPMGPSTSGANNCTGGWAVRGEMGMFFLTAGHCQAQGTVVYGVQKRFGYVLRNEDGKGMDAALVKPDSGVDALQEVVDHSNSVIGRTVGIVTNAELATPGLMLFKMGRRTGQTYGTTDGRWELWNGQWVKCAKLIHNRGDSGGPVFVRDSTTRLRAAGMFVGSTELGPESPGCFITIEDLLERFGAWLPVFSATGAVSYVGADGRRM